MWIELRDTVVERYGLEPTPALRELEAAILRQDAALQAPAAPPQPSVPAPAPSGTPSATDGE